MHESGIWYHGSTRPFEKFILPMKYSPKEQLGFGIHFAKKKEFAELYGNYIYQCQLHPRKVWDTTKEIKIGSPQDKIAQEFYKGSGRKPYVMENPKGVRVYMLNPDIRSPAMAEKIFRRYGYDAIVYLSQFGTYHMTTPGTGMNILNKTLAMVMLDNTRIEIISYENKRG
jgi:hypothetical protein